MATRRMSPKVRLVNNAQCCAGSDHSIQVTREGEQVADINTKVIN